MAVREQPFPQRGVPARAAPLPTRVLRGLWKFTRHYPLGAISGVVSVLALLIAIGAWSGWILPYDPVVFRGADRLLGIWETSRDGTRFYALGTDNLGRDMLSRMLKGAQISMFFAVGVMIISIPIGMVIGLFSAYVGGKVDLVIQRIIDAIQVIPFLVLAIAIVSILGPGIWQGFWAVAFLSIPRPARVIRGSVLSAKENMWVEAARCIGCSDRRIMYRHILPNVTAPMIVLGSYVLATAIITEASLSFLGIGAQPPTPSWGAMLSGSGAVYFTTNPRLAMMPGLVISIVVFATNMFGDAIRDALDPRLRGSR
ncbi:MAG: ABC transporter permease [Chloroflexi bacterium]|nr:ABC transporter permease [Chloroflexota bacterium]